MKKWIHKLIEQFDFEWPPTTDSEASPRELSEDRATLLFLIDTYNKHLLEIEGHPVRKVRETLDNFAKQMLHPVDDKAERILFRFRQFFSSYRIDEYTYVQKTFEDFRSIVWDFVDQLGEDLDHERAGDQEVLENLEQLKEAVEANSIEKVRTQSRLFIDFYTEYQTRKDERRSERMKSMTENLSSVQKKLADANNSIRLDHLTSAYNRKSFDEHLQQCVNVRKLSGSETSLIVLDIDHFKRVNDTHGHAVGDFVIQQCVRLLKEVFNQESHFVARIGGEEFAVVLQGHSTDATVMQVEAAMKKIRNEVFIVEQAQIKFTVSMGIAQLTESESADAWYKRADTALYESKNTGRNKYTVADNTGNIGKVAWAKRRLLDTRISPKKSTATPEEESTLKLAVFNFFLIEYLRSHTNKKCSENNLNF